jgi:hypothetical protein
MVVNKAGRPKAAARKGVRRDGQAVAKTAVLQEARVHHAEEVVCEVAEEAMDIHHHLPEEAAQGKQQIALIQRCPAISGVFYLRKVSNGESLEKFNR